MLDQLRQLCECGAALPASSHLLGDAEPEPQRGGFAALLAQLDDLDGAPGGAVADLAAEMARWLLPGGASVLDDVFGRLGRGKGRSVALSKAPHPIELWAAVLAARS